jgi:hypothetical protein
VSAAPEEYATFVVRLSRTGGRLAGVVERVRTGEKARFDELDALGALIAGMLAPHERGPVTASDGAL